ncbi:serine hydrolase domain-containing protein [Balneola sp. MJW-20]|uniref:serine hydrolase domain-containing protein n=1 Tax=Gracilimonas aurantiaca TaxID=3234185 RepID=UPI003465BED0
MKKTNISFLLILLITFITQACNAPEKVPPVPESELQTEDPMMQTIMDSVASKMRYYPDQIQFAFAFVDGDSTWYLGVLRENDILKEITNADSVYEIGSISKVFTGILLADMVVKEELQLETTLEDLGIETRTDFTFTLEELSTHTSGMPRIPSNMRWSAMFHQDNPYVNYDDDKLRDYLKNDLTTQSRPGTDYAYSNLGAGVLGYALQVKSDFDYEQLIQQVITTPLSMDQTTTDRSRIKNELVQGRDYNGKPTPNWDFNALIAAGGILSSPRDMIKFAKAQWDTTNTAIQLSQLPRHPVNSGMQIGLGWHIIYRNDGSAWLWHNGGTGGYRSTIYIDEVKKKALVILSNLSAGHSRSRLMDALGQDIMEILIKDES